VRRALTGAYPSLAGADVVVLEQAHLCGQPGEPDGGGGQPRYTFVHGDICDAALVGKLMVGVDLVVHFAAESHVDRSILGSATSCSPRARHAHPAAVRGGRRGGQFVHVSTDEVYGSIAHGSWPEDHLLEPNSPYSRQGVLGSAGRSFQPHARAAGVHHPCSQLRPYQFPEKVSHCSSPLMDGKKVPLYVDGFERAGLACMWTITAGVQLVADRGRPGEIYNIGGGDAHRQPVRAVERAGQQIRGRLAAEYGEFGSSRWSSGQEPCAIEPYTSSVDTCTNLATAASPRTAAGVRAEHVGEHEVGRAEDRTVTCDSAAKCTTRSTPTISLPTSAASQMSAVHEGVRGLSATAVRFARLPA